MRKRKYNCNQKYESEIEYLEPNADIRESDLNSFKNRYFKILKQL